MHREAPQKTAPATEKKGLALNFFEIVLNKGKINVWRTLYSKDALDNYRKSAPDYFFYRYTVDDESWTYAWQRRPTDATLQSEFAPIVVAVEEDAPVFAKVIEEAIVQFFKSNGYEVFKQKYSSIWEVRLRKELATPFGALQLQPTLAFSVHMFYSKDTQSQVLALSVQKKYKHRFTLSEEQLNEQNIDTRGWTRNSDGEIVASPSNRRAYLEGTNRAEDYVKYLKSISSEEREYTYLEGFQSQFEQVKAKLFLPDGLEVTKFLLANLPKSVHRSNCGFCQVRHSEKYTIVAPIREALQAMPPRGLHDPCAPVRSAAVHGRAGLTVQTAAATLEGTLPSDLIGRVPGQAHG
jgi:hypothetical protein